MMTALARFILRRVKKMRAGEGENRAREKGHETEGRTPSLLALIPSLRSCVPHRQLCIHTNAKKNAPRLEWDWTLPDNQAACAMSELKTGEKERVPLSASRRYD